MCGVQTTLSSASSGSVGVDERLVLVHVDRGHARAGRPAAPRRARPARSSPARLVLTSSAVGFIRARSAARDDAARGVDEAQVQRDHVALLEERLAARRDRGIRPAAPAPATPRSPRTRRSCRTPGRSRRRPCRSGRSRRCRASCRAASARRRLPLARPSATRPAAGSAASPRARAPQVSSAVAYDGVPACRSDDTTMPSRVQASTSMCGIDAALADQPELRQPLEQRLADLGCARG